jgi:hypothetical protein
MTTICFAFITCHIAEIEHFSAPVGFSMIDSAYPQHSRLNRVWDWVTCPSKPPSLASKNWLEKSDAIGKSFFTTLDYSTILTAA